MKICCASDLHGRFPEIPECDLLVLAGDYCPMANVYEQPWWLRETFGPWLESLKVPVIGVAGNHDFVWERRPDLVPKMNWTYLQDSVTFFSFGNQVLKVYGTPWQPRFFDWAFNADEPALTQKWSLIPEDTDILITHGPPAGYGDLSSKKNRIGCESLTQRIMEVSPKLVVCGHNHSGYGVYELNGTVVVNAAVCDEDYMLRKEPIVVEL